MRQDEFRFVLIDKETRQEAVLTFNDLYGYLEVRLPEERGVDIGAKEGIFVNYYHAGNESGSRDSYIPEFFRGMQISGNTSVAHKGCNDKLLVKYLPANSFIEYPEMELADFKFRVTDKENGVSTVLTFDDLLGHEEGRFSCLPQGIYIENDSREGAKTKPECLSGRIFVYNNGYHRLGINPQLDISYVGLPKERRRNWCSRPEERITEMLYALEQAWQKFPDMRLGQLISVLVSENQLFGIEDEVLLRALYDYLGQHSVYTEENENL